MSRLSYSKNCYHISINDNICKFDVLRSSLGYVSINLIDNTFTTAQKPKLNTPDQILSDRAFVIIKECSFCNKDFKITSYPLKFFDHKIQDLHIRNIQFNITNTQNQTKLMINADTQQQKTILVSNKISREPYLYKQNGYSELPYIDILSIGKEKLISKFTNLMTIA